METPPLRANIEIRADLDGWAALELADCAMRDVPMSLAE